MITGAHVLLYSSDADRDRAYIRDVLGFGAIDGGGGWLIFALPPAELAVHPGTGSRDELHAEMYLMCDDLEATIAELRERGAAISDVHRERWGQRTSITLPSGGRLGLYQPSHPTAIDRS